MTQPAERTAGAGRLRRVGLTLVMVGALAVSVRGQVEAVTPLLGGMSIVLALTNDLAAFLALNEVITTRRGEVRRWAWAVLLLAGGTAAGLNTWHALAAGVLPALWAVVVGAGPVLLAMLLSHLVALVLADPAPITTQASPAPVGQTPAPAHTDPYGAPALPAVRPGPAGAPAAAATVRLTGARPTLTSVATRRRPRSAPSASAGGTDPRVEQLVAQLQAGADLTGAVVAAQLGCSDRNGRRLLQQAIEAAHNQPAAPVPTDGMTADDRPSRERELRPAVGVGGR